MNIEKNMMSLADKINKFYDRWEYCALCKVMYITCKKCNFSSCSGGGCDDCYYEFEEAMQIVEEARKAGMFRW